MVEADHSSPIWPILDDIRTAVTRCATLIETQGADIKELKDASESRHRDHDSRIRVLEVSTMKAEDILRLTTSNSERITALEKTEKASEGVKQGISKAYTIMWGLIVFLASQMVPFINFLTNLVSAKSPH